MDVRQWVAYAGLDPRPYRSGTSVRKTPRISKVGSAFIRRSLYMPALTAIRSNEAVQAFYQRLIGRGKMKMKVVVAVMRKLLHAIYGVFKNNTPFQAEKCFPILNQA
jgi:transposase